MKAYLLIALTFFALTGTQGSGNSIRRSKCLLTLI